MADATLDDVEDALDRATDLETEAAVDLLRDAHRTVRELDDDPSVDQERRRTLEDTLSQRIREVERREEYDSGLGAAMNPDDEDAP